MPSALGAGSDRILAAATRADYATADAAVLADRSLRGGTVRAGRQRFSP